MYNVKAIPVMIRKFPTNGPHSSDENFTPHRIYVLSLMIIRSLKNVYAQELLTTQAMNLQRSFRHCRAFINGSFLLVYLY